MLPMTENDAFFTHAIVGPPQSVLLGRRLTTHDAQLQGLTIDLNDGSARLTSDWRNWVLLSRASDPIGQPRLRPGRVRGVLERYALAIAALGLMALLVSAVLIGAHLWT